MIASDHSTLRQEPPTIQLRPSMVAYTLGAVTTFLIAASIAGQLSTFLLGHDYMKGIIPLFDASREYNIPSFFSTLLLLGSASLLLVIALLARQRNARDTVKWAILACGFLFLAYDEAFQVHERLIIPFQTLLGGKNLGIFFFAWVIPGAAAVALVAVFFFGFWLRQPAGTRRAFVIAGALYIGGAIGTELAGGYWVDRFGSYTLGFNLLSALEEALEMSGIIVFLVALLRYLGDHYREVRFRLEPGA